MFYVTVIAHLTLKDTVTVVNLQYDSNQMQYKKQWIYLWFFIFLILSCTASPTIGISFPSDLPGDSHCAGDAAEGGEGESGILYSED